MSLIKKYKNSFLFLLGILVAFSLLKVDIFRNFLTSLDHFGYLSGFIAGILFVYSFTVGIGILILSILAQNLSPILLALVAGLGAALGDLVFFDLVKNKLRVEIEDLYSVFDKRHFLKKLLERKSLRWFLPFLGMLIIILPFPDEFGLVLIGLSKMKRNHLVVLAYLLNSLGIYLLIRIFTG